MKAMRLALALILSLILAVPLSLPVLAALRTTLPKSAFELDRIVDLATTTLALAVGAVLVAVPTGTVVALVLERVRIPGKPFLWMLVGVGLFVPLPVYAVAWQIVLGTWLPPLTLEPGRIAWRPWNQGLVPAAWVHGMAGLPWVIWIVGAGLRSADRGLEEDAIVAGGSWAVLRWVLLPRASLAAVAAAGWIVAQAITEIPVTDAMMVRTFAEEVYTQLVSSADGWTGAIAVTIPSWAAMILLGLTVARWTSRAFGTPIHEVERPKELRFGPTSRRAFGTVVWLAALLFAGLPLAALVWKAGGGGTLKSWDAAFLASELEKVTRSDGLVLLGSLGAALSTGILAAGLAWLACRIAVSARSFGRFLFLLCVVLAVTPGPIVGRGLKTAIEQLVTAEAHVLNQLPVKPTFPPARSLLYDQPSPVPAVWAAVLRLFPIAVVILWPAVRSIPTDLLEAARLDGLGSCGEWRRVILPLTSQAALRAVLAVTALALGEVSASKLVNPPSRPAYVLRVFDQMHYGADSTVASLCLLQLAATVGLISLAGWLVTGIRTPSSRSLDPRP